MTRLIRGASLVPLTSHLDARGLLQVGEYPDTLPFLVRRFFVIKECSDDAVRACHANPFDQWLQAVSGSVTVDLDNGAEKVSRRLDSSGGEALWVRAGVWIRLSEFETHSIVLGLSPARYEESAQFDTPQPHLIEDAE